MIASTLWIIVWVTECLYQILFRVDDLSEPVYIASSGCKGEYLWLAGRLWGSMVLLGHKPPYDLRGVKQSRQLVERPRFT